MTPGAAGGADPAVPRPRRRARRPGHPGLPADGRRPQAAGPPGLPALQLQQAGHQADRDRGQAGRRRLPRPGGGRRPVHRQHDRLPRPHLRAALPPAAQGQPARVRHRHDGRPGDHAGQPPARLLAFGGASDGIAPGAVRAPDRRPGDQRRQAAVRDRPGRPPGHADRPGRPHHHLADPGRVDRPSTPPRRPTPTPRAKKPARTVRPQEGPREEGPRRRSRREEGGLAAQHPPARARRDRRQPGPPLRLGAPAAGSARKK